MDNKKHGIPRLGVDSGFLFRRSHFLGEDYRHKTYFGPGQSDTDSDWWNGYKPPTDWPKAGSLLRVPQTVFLTSAYGDPFTPEYDIQSNIWDNLDYSYFNAGDPVPGTQHFVWVSGHQEDVVPGVQGANNAWITSPDRFTFFIAEHANVHVAYDSAVTNLWYAERTRIADSYAEAKARIEALRPGRTWVRTLDYSVAGLGTRSGGTSCLIAPGPDETYFGLNTLVVQSGPCTFNGFAPSGRSGGGVTPDDVTPDIDLVRAAYPKFAGLRTMLFAPSGDFGRFDIATPVWPPRATSYPPGSTQYRYDPASLTSDGVALVARANDELSDKNSSYRDLYYGLAASLADYGVSYEGDTSSVTADSLVSMIARHFGFDPDTGKDVG